ncbi:hypothetical protein LBMAG42_43030 [Deltaproteobacteria bacterium]|nr:hypothetical protein LBMAG42_43030 [Deltaproteobacteria bacterium]
MAPTRVVIDACVLYDAAVRDLMLRLGMARLIEPIWSASILEEAFTALARNRPDLSPEQLAVLKAAMSRAFPRAEFATGMGSWMDGLELDECGNLYAPNYSDRMLWRISPDGLTKTAMVTRSSTDYGHGVTWGNGVGSWDDHTLYQPQPYASYHVREVEIGFASADTVRTRNGVAVSY